MAKEHVLNELFGRQNCTSRSRCSRCFPIGQTTQTLIWCHNGSLEPSRLGRIAYTRYSGTHTTKPRLGYLLILKCLACSGRYIHPPRLCNDCTYISKPALARGALYKTLPVLVTVLDMTRMAANVLKNTKQNTSSPFTRTRHP